jgi:hypothetical protein
MECRVGAGKESVMALEPFCFVHAADVRLDAPLAGLGNLDEDIRRLVEDATLVAFDRVVHACLQHNAEFLLLTGRVWFAPLTPRAWRTLATGCQLLAEYGIRAFWAGDLPATDSDVRQMLAELENLTLLPESDPDPVAIVKEGRVVASLSGSDSCDAPGLLPESLTAVPAAASAFHIRVLPPTIVAPKLPAVTAAPGGDTEFELAPLLDLAMHAGIDYLAPGGDSRRLLRAFEGGMLHCPGPAQGVDSSESGPHGCSLVEVDSEGASHVEFLPTAAVRWEHLRLGVERGMSRVQLVDRMQQMLLDQEAGPAERLVCVHWQLVGSGPLFDALDAGEATAGLPAAIDAGLPTCADLTRRHVFDLRRRRGTEDDSTAQDFLNVLAEHGATGLGEPGRAFARLGAPHWARHVISSLPRQVDRAVVDTASRLGRDWLQNPSHR